MSTEADTCRKFVIPRLKAADWDSEPHSIGEQQTFTDGEIVVIGGRPRRRAQKRADYILRYRRDYPIAVVEAKPDYKLPGDGLQQAKEYARILGLKFAYATNGTGIVEFDFTTGVEREVDRFPGPDELWQRLAGAEGLSDVESERLLTPFYHIAGQNPRYYQQIAINRTVQAALQARQRMLLTMATGTGKTLVAFQICWKLWESRRTRDGRYGRPRILYLADRNFLVDDPKDKTFAPFGLARDRIDRGNIHKGREMYFATYQSLAEDERRPGLYREYARDFFDLVIVDECHRGSARDDSSWREILEYFAPAYQLGMTATPKREETADTYRYFGDPLFEYSLRQGIEDGFLAPYRVHQVVTNWDATGWRPSAGEVDRYGREIPDDEYRTKDFEREVALRARTDAIARHLAGFMRATNRFAKTVVFCVDQEHALEMKRALNNANADLVQQYPDYACRVTADEGEYGRLHLDAFTDVEKQTPVILTTSQLLTTGMDAPTCQNVVLARVVGSMVEFKQIIGRGTRVRDDYGKLFFNIVDYTGSALDRFADPEFDGFPAIVTQVAINADGDELPGSDVIIQPEESPAVAESGGDYDTGIPDADSEGWEPRKFYFDDGQVEIVAHVVRELAPDGSQLRMVSYTDYSGEQVRTLYVNAAELRAQWADPTARATVLKRLEERGIDLDELRAATKQAEADPLDLLCHLAFNGPLRTRRERAELLRRERQDFFERFGPEARAILEELLEKYAEYGAAQFRMPAILQVPPISDHGNVQEIMRLFGGAARLRSAVEELQALLYAA